MCSVDTPKIPKMKPLPPPPIIPNNPEVQLAPVLDADEKRAKKINPNRRSGAAAFRKDLTIPSTGGSGLNIPV